MSSRRRKERLTFGKIVLNLNILFSGHAEEGGDAVAICVPVRKTPGGQ